jgi:alpha-methylacyl-CoA racemase
VVDCAMTDGSALLMAMMWGFRAQGRWTDQRGTNVIDTGAPFYETYETADGQFVAVGAIEPQFYAELRHVLGIDGDPRFEAQFDQAQWPAQKAELTRLFKSKTRAEWCALFDQAEACVTPVLSMAEALEHPHNLKRQTFVTIDGVPQPAPAPRFKPL